ncbi:uncharacterized protein LOC135817800 isoform X1 [Sycon ciliatum]|uniref:uncharacterized protein LOC135817800 isoform X1 n=1 Tax=Sycon ciliatum TaxID=27933 RepID=UPI0031F6552F
MDGFKLLAVLLAIQLGVLATSHGQGIVVSPLIAMRNVSEYISLKCTVSDLPDVQEIYWTKRSGSLDPGRSFTYSHKPLQVKHLLLYKIKTVDSGEYVCNVRTGNQNSGSVATATSLLRVMAPKPKAVSPCLSRPCQNGGHCMDIQAPQVSDYVCLCQLGYGGRHCQVMPTTAPPPTTAAPTTADPCAASPCNNGGECGVAFDGSVTCSCTGNFVGSTCDVYDNCANNPCQNGGLCHNLSNRSQICGVRQFECTCPVGFTGHACEQRDFCGSSPCYNGATCVNVDDVSYDCVCMDGYVGERCQTMPFDGCGKYGQRMELRELKDFFYTETTRSSPPSADIVFVIDESRSMITEHQWLHEVSTALDTSLQGHKIGVKVPNQFGLVGFARDDPMDVTGRIIHMDTGCKFGQASHFKQATSNLAINGRLEDMYLGIILALDQYDFRPGMACQIIGVTDEGRNPLNPSANHRDSGNVPYEFEYMLRRLTEKGCVLNVVVNQQMDVGGKRGLGVGSNGVGYVDVAGGAFDVIPDKGRPIPDTGHGSTHESYTKLALATHGGAWDLNKLRLGGDTGMAFTKAFVHLKQREISNQLCERCTCDAAPEAFCRPGCLGEPPVSVSVQSLYSHLSEAAVNEGGSALFECQSGGDPAPTCSWSRADGTALPPSARYLGEDNCTLMVPDVSSITCVQCLASNIEGATESTVQCLDYAANCELRDGRKILHGSTARSYSETKLEDLRTISVSSAVVILVVDESGSMSGEHQWLKTTITALEKNLMERGVGSQGRANQYALVGFASPRANRLGHIINAAEGRHCGTADEISLALKRLRQDGRKEDGYSAIGMALDSISCVQNRQDGNTALQVILVTDEDRDVLKPEWTKDTIRTAIMRRGGVLNAVVKNRFHGKDDDMRNVRAMGIDRRQRAVIVNRQKNDFYFLPHGMPTTDSGHGTTERDYVDLATRTGGGAWDLDMLRDDSYREAFTKGFIAAKVEEIQVQLVSRCEECACRNGTTTCDILPNIINEQSCLNPIANAALSVRILGESSAVAGGFAKLQCQVEAPADEGRPAVMWDPHPLNALQYNGGQSSEHALEFAVVSEHDAGMYKCIGRNQFGASAAIADFNVAPSATNPYQGIRFGGSSGSQASVSVHSGVIETSGRATSCLQTAHINTHEERESTIRKFKFGSAASAEEVTVHCIGQSSDVEIGYKIHNDPSMPTLVFPGFNEELPHPLTRDVESVAALKFTPNDMQDTSGFQFGCRARGSGPVTCAHSADKCLRLAVTRRHMLVFPKERICPNGL